MNVGELVEALKGFDPTLEVVTEGCDCYGDVAEAVLLPRLRGTVMDPIQVDLVLIKRSEQHRGGYDTWGHNDG